MRMRAVCFAFLMLFALKMDGFCGLSSSFGVNAHIFGRDFADLPWIEKAGIQWARVDFFWADIEKENNQFSWELTDRLVKEAKKHSVELLPVLAGTPAWSLAKDVEKSVWYPPEKFSDYADFIRHVVARYKNDITYYEIWNEENGPVFWKPFPDVKEYARLLKAGAEAVRAECPLCKVVLGGLAGVDVNFAEALYGGKAQSYFDVMNIHPYRFFSKSPDRGGLADDLQNLNKLMKKYGDEKKPVWISEIGWPTHKGMKHVWVPVTLEQQAAYLVQSYVIAWSEGIEKIFWYDFKNDGTDETYFEYNQGLMTADYVKKPSYGAYMHLAKNFSEAQFVSVKKWNKRNKTYVFKTKYEIIVVLWDDVGKSAVLFKKNVFYKSADKYGRETGAALSGEAVITMHEPLFLFSKNVKTAELESFTFVWEDKKSKKEGKKTL